MASIKEAAMERIAETTSGMIATAIKGKDNSDDKTDTKVPQQSADSADLTFGENSLSSADSIPTDPESEVAAFCYRDNETLEEKSP